MLLLLPFSAFADGDFEFNNGRLPEASKMLEAMCGVNVDTRVLLITSARWTHKVVTFVYPTGSKHVWVWDPQTKAREVRAAIEDPLAIAKSLIKDLAPKEQVVSATYVDDNAPKVCSR